MRACGALEIACRTWLARPSLEWTAVWLATCVGGGCGPEFAGGARRLWAALTRGLTWLVLVFLCLAQEKPALACVALGLAGFRLHLSRRTRLATVGRNGTLGASWRTEFALARRVAAARRMILALVAHEADLNTQLALRRTSFVRVLCRRIALQAGCFAYIRLVLAERACCTALRLLLRLVRACSALLAVVCACTRLVRADRTANTRRECRRRRMRCVVAGIAFCACGLTCSSLILAVMAVQARTLFG